MTIEKHQEIAIQAENEKQLLLSWFPELEYQDEEIDGSCAVDALRLWFEIVGGKTKPGLRPDNEE